MRYIIEAFFIGALPILFFVWDNQAVCFGKRKYVEKVRIFYVEICCIIRKKNERENRALIREKIKLVIKRYVPIQKMLKKGQREGFVRVNNRKERLVIDEEMLAIVEIINEIVQQEQTQWLKEFYRQILKGEKDIYILIGCPVERGKYYETKKRFYNKIYQCCIFKRLVLYDEILSEDIG